MSILHVSVKPEKYSYQFLEKIQTGIKKCWFLRQGEKLENPPEGKPWEQGG